MDKEKKQETKNRDTIIKELTDNILDTATSITEPELDQKTLDKIEQDIKERLNFEANVLLNETVTKITPKKAYKEFKEIPERTFQRFGKNLRFQHILMFTSVITLIITGMPLKFPELGISRFIILNIFGGLENSTFIHRIGATGLIAVGLWHLLYIIFSKTGRKDFITLIPRSQDVKDFFKTIMYYIGKVPSGPKFGRFSFIEKFDYWAVYWGMVVMIGSGSIMWFKQYFPKYLYDIGREAHSDEGLLATLAIVVWHFYNVHFNPEVFPMSKVWWHGKLTEEEIKHHHPLEYAEIVEAESKKILEQQKKDQDREHNIQ